MIDITNDQELRKIIMNHFVSSTNKGFTNNPLASIHELKSESCSDELSLEIVINNNKFDEIKFEGSACAISTSAIDILISLILGKTYEEAIYIINVYEKMIITGIIEDVEILQELVALKNIKAQKNRRACALLGSNGIKEFVINQK